MRRPPFDTAPALFAYNVPRSYTALLRSREYARATGLTVSWGFSQDIPLHREDRELSDVDLHKKRSSWPQRLDQETSHVASQLPLVSGLPMRLTDTVSRELKLFRGRKCVLRGWAPHPEQERFDVDGEWVLTKMPKVLYLYFEKCNMAGAYRFGTWSLSSNASFPHLAFIKENKGKSTQDGLLCSFRFLLDRAHDPGSFIESSVRPAC